MSSVCRSELLSLSYYLKCSTFVCVPKIDVVVYTFTVCDGKRVADKNVATIIQLQSQYTKLNILERFIIHLLIKISIFG